MSEEHGRMSREKAALLTSVQALKADNDRLRGFKRRLLHSLQSDSEVDTLSMLRNSCTGIVHVYAASQW